MDDTTNVIEINKLSKYYGKSRGIVEVSFDVRQGEIFGFIGPNGEPVVWIPLCSTNFLN